MVRRLIQRRPPILSRFLIFLFVPSDDRDAVLGDLEEEFHDRAACQSIARARMWHWHQSVGSIPYWLFTKTHGGAIALMFVCLSAYSLFMCWEYWIEIVGVHQG